MRLIDRLLGHEAPKPESRYAAIDALSARDHEVLDKANTELDRHQKVMTDILANAFQPMDAALQRPKRTKTS